MTTAPSGGACPPQNAFAGRRTCPCRPAMSQVHKECARPAPKAFHHPHKGSKGRGAPSCLAMLGWFLHSSPQANAVEVKKRIQTLNVAVRNGICVVGAQLRNSPLNQTMLLSSVEKLEAWMAPEPLPRMLEWLTLTAPPVVMPLLPLWQSGCSERLARCWMPFQCRLPVVPKEGVLHGQFGVASIKFKGVASIVFHAALVDIHSGRAPHLQRIVAIELHIDGVERHRTRSVEWKP